MVLSYDSYVEVRNKDLNKNQKLETESRWTLKIGMSKIMSLIQRNSYLSYIL